MLEIEIVDRFQEAYAADLKEIVGQLAAVEEALDDAQHQPQIAGDERVPGGGVALLRERDEPHFLGFLHDDETRRVDAADLDFTALQKKHLRLNGVLPPAEKICSGARGIFSRFIIRARGA